MTQPRRFTHRLVFAACVLACAAPLTQNVAQAATWSFCWGGKEIQGSGAVKAQQRALGHFNGVSNALPATVDIRIGDTESVTVETDDNLLPMIETVVEDGILKIQPAKRNQSLCAKSIKIVVYARALDRISLSGSGSIESDPLRTPKLRVDLGGSGTVKLKGVETDLLSVALGGSGTFQAAGGTAKEVTVAIGGSGDVKMGGVRSDSVSVSIGGSGNATVWARESLNMSMAGSGDVHYYGDPRVRTSSAGSGTARRIGAAP